MFINDVYYREIGLKSLQAVCMQDYAIRYFSDLYRSYKMPLEANQVERVYRYEDIAAYLFDIECNQKACAESDYLFFPLWGWILDSCCAMPELYLKNKFKWSGSILDVRDCGSLCAYYALHLILKLYQSRLIKNAVCCSIESTFKLSIDVDNQIYPEINYVGLLSFSCRQNTYSDIEVIYCDLHVNKNGNYQKLILEKTKHLVSHYRIAKNQYRIFMRRMGDEIQLSKNIELISHPISSGFLYDMLNRVQMQSIAIQVNYIFIIDIDPTASCFGVLLIKLGGKYVNSINR